MNHGYPHAAIQTFGLDDNLAYSTNGAGYGTSPISRDELGDLSALIDTRKVPMTLRRVNSWSILGLPAHENALYKIHCLGFASKETGSVLASLIYSNYTQHRNVHRGFTSNRGMGILGILQCTLSSACCDGWNSCSWGTLIHLFTQAMHLDQWDGRPFARTLGIPTWIF